MKNKYAFSPFLHLLLLFIIFLPFSGTSQQPEKPSAAELHQAIKKLNVLGSVLYVAAHPDDENQRLISYCANEKLYNVTYLSLTRGDGGQNLIGPELRELLGVLRTEELLMARSVDGGKQRFSRANDFGYSKTPKETLEIWNKDEVLADVIWTIRHTRPDVIINRFYHDDAYRTHGHHTSSAMLSVEAFDLAGKTDVYPEQLKFVSPWQPLRQFYNTSWWFYGGQEAFEKIDKSHLFSLDAGVYLPLKGKSNTEVAAEARSMHRCQSFGAMGSRGETLEWFEFIKGDRPKTNDPFDGINTTWTRVEGGAPIGTILARVEQQFKPDNPGASVPDLLQAMQLIKTLPDGYWKRVKLAEIKEVIRGCLGLYLEATASSTIATPGDPVKLRLECIYRAQVPGNGPVTLTGLSVLPGIFDTIPAQNLTCNIIWELEKTVQLPENMTFTAPYWLLQPSTEGMYTVENQEQRGQPETPRDFRVRWSLNVNGTPLELESTVAYKERQADKGEVWYPFDILPPVSVELTESFYLATGKSVPVTVRARANRDNVKGQLKLLSPAGWPNSYAEDNPPVFELKNKGDVVEYTFDLQPSTGPEVVTLGAGFEIDGALYTSKQITIDYEHIPKQYVLLPAHAQAARVDLKVSSKNVGYYMGAGDEGPAALRLMGCNVTMLEDADLTVDNLRQYDAVVLGVRAYNTKDVLHQRQQVLFEYVKGGGTLVNQYNTSYNLNVDNVGPYPLKLGRGRVTDQAAEIRFLKPGHPALNTPNQLTSKDFENWVQERGLYFPSEWDEHYTPLLSCNDPGEEALDGSLLVAPYGNGYFVYTGLSFFRQFPAGVPGAYRLFANLISLKMSP
ncbi:MAG: LmbE family protein [Bacteroidetes bacterium]|nr:MAG: LmbE family protein [Bacteroidota bacterium]